MALSNASPKCCNGRFRCKQKGTQEPNDKLPVSRSRGPERSTARQATSSGIVKGVCGVGLRSRPTFDRNFWSLADFSTRFRSETPAVDAADPLHWDAPNQWHPPPPKAEF